MPKVVRLVDWYSMKYVDIPKSSGLFWASVLGVGFLPSGTLYRDLLPRPVFHAKWRKPEI